MTSLRTGCATSLLLQDLGFVLQAVFNATYRTPTAVGRHTAMQRSISFAATSLRSPSPPTLKRNALARACQAAAGKMAAAGCRDGDAEPLLGRQPVRPQHTSPSLSCSRPVIVGSEWYKSPVASKLAAFTELAKGAEPPVLVQCVKTKWTPTPNSAPDGSYARRRLFDRNAAGLPPVRAISDLP